MKRQTFILIFRENPETVDALLRAAENDINQRRSTAYSYTSEYSFGHKREVTETDRRMSERILATVVPLSGFLARLQRQVRLQYKTKAAS